MYKLTYSPHALKQLEKLEQDLRERIITSLDRIRIRPETYLIKLLDDKGYKLRVGKYRIILDIDHKHSILSVIKIGHRKNIYKRL